MAGIRHKGTKDMSLGLFMPDDIVSSGLECPAQALWDRP